MGAEQRHIRPQKSRRKKSRRRAGRIRYGAAGSARRRQATPRVALLRRVRQRSTEDGWRHICAPPRLQRLVGHGEQLAVHAHRMQLLRGSKHTRDGRGGGPCAAAAATADRPDEAMEADKLEGKPSRW